MVAKARRRRFTAAEKLRVLRATDGCSKSSELGALLRREDLYSSCRRSPTFVLNGELPWRAQQRGEHVHEYCRFSEPRDPIPGSFFRTIPPRVTKPLSLFLPRRAKWVDEPSRGHDAGDQGSPEVVVRRGR